MIFCWIFVGIGMLSIIIPISIGLVKLPLIQIIMYTKYRFPNDALNFIYFACFMQFVPYFIGCSIGFVILENRLLKFTKWQEILIWTLTSIFLLTIPFSSYLFASNEMKISGDPSIMNALNFCLLILLWSLSNGWIIYQCSIKPKMIVTRILSANLFKPLSRLSFSLYLSHLMTIWFFAHQVRQPISIGTWIDLSRIMSTTFSASFIIGYLLHLTFEAPTIGLLLLFKDKKLLKTSSSVHQRFKRIIVRDNLQNEIRSECLNIVEYMIRNPIEQEWTAKIIDSGIFNRPIGLLSGTTELVEHEWLIDYIEKWYQNDNYYSIATAICFPSICNEREIHYDVLRTVHFNVTYCQSNDDDQQPSSTDNFGLRVAWTILLTPWFLIIPATILELIFEFRFIHGIRAFGALFIMMAHAGGLVLVPTLMPVSVIARFPNDAIQLSRTLMAQPFYNVDFFPTYLTASTKNLKIGFLPYVLLRWLRLTLPLIGTICLNIGLESLGNGLLFHMIYYGQHYVLVMKNWWKHFLYFNNYIPIEDMCNISTWFLAADLQAHIIAFGINIWQEILIWSLSSIFLLTIPFSSYLFASNEMKISGDPSIMNAINFFHINIIMPKMIVTRILSANLFKPLSRLSFSLYLSHLMTIWFFAHQVRQPIQFGTWINLSPIISTTFSASFIIGYLLHLTFEAPTIGLLLLFKDKKLLKTSSSVHPNSINANAPNNSKLFSLLQIDEDIDC
ncbi:hypothetical protein DERP_003713 [Dermatophagoides pteronyssinus]|uniref:O-acyltransferase like protein-like n=1 Tax=Dermatophagoides pteronyssinus TaxID=6956 RepID=A0ABQ8JLI1_DERPT|nr:hypothetical protein DERP_003713 [Dermatophagoides pteronyssinus]